MTMRDRVSTVFVLGFLAAACSAQDGGNTRQGAMDADAGSTVAHATTSACVGIGGTCMASRAMNMTCRGIDGAFEVHADLCEGTGGMCCVAPGLDGQLPQELKGFVKCGGVLCPPQSTCSHGVDFVICATPDVPRAHDAGSCAR